LGWRPGLLFLAINGAVRSLLIAAAKSQAG
jgi:hypothetical protein